MRKVIDLYNMVGYCPARAVSDAARFAVKNLVDASDAETISMQGRLAAFISRRLLGLKSRVYGLVLHSGSEANEVALYLARKKTGRRKVLCTNISHASIRNACEKLCIEPIVVDVNHETMQADATAIVSVLEKHGHELACLNVTFGTTYFGSTENFLFDRKVVELCKRHGIWVHVDAAYGGTIIGLLKPGFTEAFFSPAIISSVTVDTHKFLGVVGAGVLVLRDQRLKCLVGKEAAYFEGHTTALGTTRGVIPLATSLGLISRLGMAGMRIKARICLAKAGWLAKKLGHAGFGLLAPLESGVVAVRLSSEREVDSVKKRLLREGFKVSPIKLKARGYSVFGFRVVVTPKKEMSWGNLRMFVNACCSIENGAKPVLSRGAARVRTGNAP